VRRDHADEVKGIAARLQLADAGDGAAVAAGAVAILSVSVVQVARPVEARQ